MANPVNGIATTAQNLPAGKRPPEFPVDREALAKAAGGSVGDGYRAPLGMIKELIRAVKAGYVKVTIDDGLQNPSALDVYQANSAAITEAMGPVMKTARLFDQQSQALPLVNNEDNALWPYVAEMLAHPDQYGCLGFQGIASLKPIGRNSKLAAPAA